MGPEVQTMKSRTLLTLTGVALISFLLTDAATVWARAGSGGSRGSRSYSAPATPSTPSSPARSVTQPTAPQQRPGLFGGLMGGIAGFALGGLLGSMLFGGMGGGGFGGGLGLLEMLLIGGAIFFLFRMFRARQSAEPRPAYASAGGASASAYGAGGQGWSGGGGGTTLEAPSGPSDLERGVGFLQQMDPSFDPGAFAGWAKTAFVDVQGGITRRDLSAVNDRLTPQEYARLQAQCDQLRSARRTNRIEQIQIGRAEVTEAWQESGQDWATVYFAVSLVDCTVDDTTGAVVEGSKTPQDVEEDRKSVV